MTGIFFSTSALADGCENLPDKVDMEYIHSYSPSFSSKYEGDSCASRMNKLVISSLIKHLDLINIFAEEGRGGLDRVIVKENSLTRDYIVGFIEFLDDIFSRADLIKILHISTEDLLSMGLAGEEWRTSSDLLRAFYDFRN